MHKIPNAHDAVTPDADAVGYDAREHEHGQHAVTGRTVYVVYHHEQPVSREYDSYGEASLFMIFDTPGTADYAVRPVHSTITGA